MTSILNVPIISPTQTIAGDDTSITDAARVSDHDDDITLVPSIDLPPRQAAGAPQSRFMRFYNTARLHPSEPLAYDDSDPEADWAGAAQGETTEILFMDFLRFVKSKIRSFVERLGRMTFPTACL